MEGLRVPCLARSQTIPTEQEGGSTLLLLTWRELIQTYWCDTLMDSGLKHTQGSLSLKFIKVSGKFYEAYRGPLDAIFGQ